MSQNTDQFFKDAVLGHPGLFVLFFTEMWSDFLITECIISSVLTSSLAKEVGMVSKMPWLWNLYHVCLFYSHLEGFLLIFRI
jgi:hypothetical protein